MNTPVISVVDKVTDMANSTVMRCLHSHPKDVCLQVSENRHAIFSQQSSETSD